MKYTIAVCTVKKWRLGIRDFIGEDRDLPLSGIEPRPYNTWPLRRLNKDIITDP